MSAAWPQSINVQLSDLRKMVDKQHFEWGFPLLTDEEWERICEFSFPPNMNVFTFKVSPPETVTGYVMKLIPTDGN